MADFNVNVQGASSAPSPRSPVQDNSTAQAINSMGGLLGSVGVSVGNAIISGQQNKAQAEQARILETLTQNIRRRADLVDQGVQSSSAAYRRIRVMASEVEAAHPALSKEIRDLVKAETSSGGLASNLVTGTQAEQDKHALSQQEASEAVKAGFLHPEDSPEEQAKSLQNYREFNLGQTQMQLLQKQQELRNSQLQEQSTRLSMANTSLSIQKNKLSLQQERDKIQYNKAFTQMAIGQYGNFQKDIGKVTNDPNLSVDDKVAQIRTLKDLYMSKANGDAIAAGKDGAPASIAKIFENLAQTNEDILTGKFQGANAQAHLDSMISHAQDAMLSGDPKVLDLVALGVKIGAIDSTSRELIANKVADMVHKGAKLPPPGGGMPSSNPPDLTHTNDDERSSVKQYTNIVKENAGDVAANVPMPQVHRDQTQTMVNTALDSLYKHGSIAADPSSLQTVVNMFASPQLGKYLANPAHGVDKQLQDKAANAFHEYYITKVIPLIKDEFDSTTIKIGIGPARNNYEFSRDVYAPTNSQIGAVYNNGTVSFQFIGPSTNFNTETQQTLSKMNKDIAPLLNTMVKAQAHLNGSTNYDTYATDVLNSLFPQEAKQTGSN